MFNGERLRSLRTENGMTQEELGKKLGLSKAAICLYESNKRSPKLEIILDLMYMFGVSADYLLGSDVIVKIQDAQSATYRTLTSDEMEFINELRKDDVMYKALFQVPKRGVEYIKRLMR